MNSKRIFFVLVVLSLTFFPEAVSASERLFDFRAAAGAGSLQGWEVKNATAADMTERGLRLRAPNFVKIISPRGLGIPHDAGIMEINFFTSVSLYANVFFLTSGGKPLSAKDFKVKTGVGYGDGKVSYRIYVGGVAGRGQGIDAVRLYFSGSRDIGVTLVSIRFYNPGLSGLAGFFWEKFWEPDFITGSSPNFISMPVAGPFSFPAFLYILLIILTVVGTISLFVKRKILTKGLLLKTIVISFLTCAFLYTLRMDYNWLVIWRDDAAAFSAKSSAERIRDLNYVDGKNPYNFFNYIDFVKESVPGEKTVRLIGYGFSDVPAAISRYYLLPVRVSDTPDYFLTYGEKNIRFDPGDLTLYEGGRAVASPVVPFRVFAANARIFEVVR